MLIFWFKCVAKFFNSSSTQLISTLIRRKQMVLKSIFWWFYVKYFMCSHLTDSFQSDQHNGTHQLTFKNFTFSTVWTYSFNWTSNSTSASSPWWCIVKTHCHLITLIQHKLCVMVSNVLLNPFSFTLLHEFAKKKVYHIINGFWLLLLFWKDVSASSSKSHKMSKQ